MARTVNEAVREVCLSFPETEEVVSHGNSDFRVRGKSFASYVVNHHGDGRVALWLNAPAGSQEHYTSTEPKHFYVPPYVGPRGWLGMNLDKGLSWARIAAITRQAYEKVAPPALSRELGPTIKVKLPVGKLRPEVVDPLKGVRGREVLKQARKLLLEWPEVNEDRQFGSPVWRAGKKTFVWLHVDRSMQGRSARLQLYFWVGVAAQGIMTADERYTIPMYLGHNGWIALDVTTGADWKVIRGLALGSYRHFAQRRMLKALGDES